MISCQNFRNTLVPGTTDPALLEHLRRCDACLDYAIGVDPDYFFRSIGGETLVPPGGVDAFVDDVMRQVNVRRKENAIAPQPATTWRQRLAIAAMLAAGISAATLVYRNDQPSHTPASQVAAVTPKKAPVVPVALTTKPIIDSYESKNATIVEVPSDNNVNVVMIFDEKLPADL